MGHETPRLGRTAPIPHRWDRVESPGEISVVAAYETVIAGGGPAGLTAAYELTRHGHRCVVLEADPTLVGGISRTDQYKGYRFDIGGHRFFSKSAGGQPALGRDPRRPVPDTPAPEPDLLRPQVLPLPAQARRRPRRSSAPSDRPPASCQLLQGHGSGPIRPERSFEDWVVNRFGRLLFEIFFKTYTEKVWGMPTVRDLGRLGGPADQGPEPHQGRARAPWSASDGAARARSSRR